jgi:hypothetical protein
MTYEAELAWELAQIVEPYLGVDQRHATYVAIGIGECFSAIFSLMRVAVDKRVELPNDLAERFLRWLDAYVGSDDETYLRGAIAELTLRQGGSSLDTTSPRRYLTLEARYQRGDRP